MPILNENEITTQNQSLFECYRRPKSRKLIYYFHTHNIQNNTARKHKIKKLNATRIQIDEKIMKKQY